MNPEFGQLIVKYSMLIGVWYAGMSGILLAQDLTHVNDQRPVKISSGISLQTSYYSVEGIPFRRQPFNWALTGTPEIEVYGIRFPFSFYVSNQQLSFQQPFNQIGIHPTYKWITAHLGYSSVHFSDYTLAGRRFLGAGVELNPGKLRFGIIRGRFQKAIERDSIVQTTPEGYLSGVPNGAFARKGFAVKLGIGKKENYFDLIYMKAEDDTLSLSGPLSLETLDPEQNKVIGIKNHFSSKSGFIFESDAAISQYTSNLRSEPLDTQDIPSVLYSWSEPKLSSQWLYAANAKLGVEGKTVKTALRYRRISRDFKTMGAYYFQTDLEEWAAQASAGLLKKKVQVRANAGIQRNNLSEDRTATTKKIIGSIYVGAQVTRSLHTDFSYANYGITQRPQQTGHPDSIRIDQVLSNWQLGGNYQLPSSLPQSIALQFNFQHLEPRDTGYAQVSMLTSTNMMGIYTISIPSQKMNIAITLQRIANTQANFELSCFGAGINMSKSLSKGNVNVQAGTQFFSTKRDEADKENTLSINGGATCRITNALNLNLNIKYTNTDSSGQYPGAAFKEWLSSINLQFHF